MYVIPLSSALSSTSRINSAGSLFSFLAAMKHKIPEYVISISSLKPPVDLNFKSISFVSGISTVISAISFKT